MAIYLRDPPWSRTRRAASSPLFGLAPDGVYPAVSVTGNAVSSYLTFSPLPHSMNGAVYFLRHFPSFRLNRNDPAFAGHPALWSSDFPHPGKPGCGHLSTLRVIVILYGKLLLLLIRNVRKNMFKFHENIKYRYN